MKSWFLQSVIAMILVVPAWLSITFYKKNFHVSAEIFLVWYFGAAAVGIVIFKAFSGVSLIEFFPAPSLVIGMLLIGLTLGAAANALLFSAVSVAPNPGLPIAISGTASVCVFLVSVVLGSFLPKYFSEVRFDWQAFVGVLLVVSGIALIAVRK